MAKLPSTLLPLRHGSTSSIFTAAARPTIIPCGAGATGAPATQVRHATLIPRPQRAYTFTQIVQLSDGSTYTSRTTSPQPLFKLAKDSRNHLLWQPSEKSLQNVEEDEAGKLAAFRERFGRAWDMAGPTAGAPAPADAKDAEGKGKEKKGAAVSADPVADEKDAKDAAAAAEAGESEDVLGDLLSGYAADMGIVAGGGSTKAQKGKKVAPPKRKKARGMV